jgi:hypothetical protein
MPSSAVVTKISEDGAGVIRGGGGPLIPAGVLMVLLSKVTAPFRAKALPWSTAPVPSEIDDNAKIFPANTELVPSVAELPICQNTLEAWAPLVRRTVLLVAVVSALAIWKMNWAFVLPPALSVRVPAIPSVELEV